MEEWNVPKVSVNLHLTPEAAEILRQYAGDRNRGKFVSQLLIAQRQRDDLQAKEQRQVRRDQKAAEQMAKFNLGGHPKRKPKRKGGVNGARR